MRYQIVESQDEAREIMEGMYKKNLEEQGKLSRQVQKLQMVGVEGELLEPKFAGSYSKLKQIELRYFPSAKLGYTIVVTLSGKIKYSLYLDKISSK